MWFAIRHSQTCFLSDNFFGIAFNGSYIPTLKDGALRPDGKGMRSLRSHPLHGVEYVTAPSFSVMANRRCAHRRARSRFALHCLKPA